MSRSNGGRVRQLNYELNRLETAYQRTCLVSYPPLIQISTGSRCNLKCVFCTDRSPRGGNEYRDLSFEEFLPVTEGLAYASTVQLNGWGEPFFNPDYERIFDYVAKNYGGIHIYISSNGTLLGERWQKRLLEYEDYSLNVSINAADPRTYRAVTGRDLFGKVMTNLQAFMIRRSGNGCHMRGRLSVSFVVVKDNLREMAAFVELAASVGVDLVQFMDLMYLHERSDSLSVLDRIVETRQYFEEAILRADQHGVRIGSFLTYGSSDYLSLSGNPGDTPPSNSPPETSNPCYAPWNSLLMCQDGTVMACCRARLPMGNVRTDGLDAVWNGAMYQNLRATVNSDSPPDGCRHCPVKTGLAGT